MPRKRLSLTSEEQSKRFTDDAQRMIDAGELSPIAGEKGLDCALRQRRKPSSPS